MSLRQQLHEKAHAYQEDWVKLRRHLHQHPELSFREYNTQKFVADRLSQWSIPYQSIATTGLLAEIRGQNPDSKTVALRGDMDALPITETNQVDYASKNPGVMHACGHDVHTTSLLGAARLLNEIRDQFQGTVRLLFQPGEERLPGGATLMIKDQALQNPKPAGILGQHVMPLIEAGKVGFRSGMYMASTDEIYVRVIGKGGHGAMPQMNIDPVAIAAQIITALQQVVSRKAAPIVPSVLSFGKVIAEGATNVIPSEVYMEGTFRTLDEEWRDRAHQTMKQMAEGIAEGMGARCEFDIHKGYPFLKNDEALTSRSKAAAQDYLGPENVQDLDIWMAGEDFAWYTHELPGCFYRLGVRNEKQGITSSVHTSTFDIDEKALPVGTGLLAWLALNELQPQS